MAANDVPRLRAELVGFFQELFGSFNRLDLVGGVENDRVGRSQRTSLNASDKNARSGLSILVFGSLES